MIYNHLSIFDTFALETEVDMIQGHGIRTIHMYITESVRHQMISTSTLGLYSLSHEIGCYNDCMALKFDRHLSSAATEVPIEFQSDLKSLNSNPAVSRLREI